MKIIIDCREKELIKQINQQVLFTPSFKKIEVESGNLPIGDIIIQNEDKSELIIERKTIPDLLASIKDGRYEEQSYRLNGSEYHNHNIMYLIEGDTNNKKFFQKVDKLTFYSALFSLNYYKGFSVIKTQNLTETAVFICNSLIKMQKSNKKPFYIKSEANSEVNSEVNSEANSEVNSEANLKQDGSLIKTRKEDTLEITTLPEGDEKDYVHVVKKVKKENITCNNIDEIMLSQVPGISSTIAIAIIKKFKSLKNIVSQYNDFIEKKRIDNQNQIDNQNENQIDNQNNDDLKKEVVQELFNDIFYLNTKGDKRKITKTSMNNVYTFLLENK